MLCIPDPRPLLLSELGLVLNAKKTVTNSQPVRASFPDFAFDECPHFRVGTAGWAGELRSASGLAAVALGGTLNCRLRSGLREWRCADFHGTNVCLRSPSWPGIPGGSGKNHPTVLREENGQGTLGVLH